MSESVVESERNRVGCMVDGSHRTIPPLANSSLTSNTLLEESVLHIN